ncbi:sugar ABC transporter permease [Parafrigoribacterium mesophilum]|uniref:carbohydrate ABC transporter permease n=1 Tax=Parafrigoribacterium mesophilum TaxID=433646 RepID=UPI0031FCB1B7
MTTSVIQTEVTPDGRATSVARPTRFFTPKRKRGLVVWAMLSPALLGLAVFFVYPLIANVYFSMTRYDLLSEPQWVGFRNYIYLFTQDPNVVTAAFNTLWFVVILVPVRVITAMAVAGLLVRAKSGAGFWRTLFYLPALVPPVASTVAFVFLFNPGTGPVNQILRFFGIKGPLWFSDPAWSKPSLVLLGIWVLGDIMIIFLASLLDVPQEQYEAAALDGANGAQKVRYVTIPSITPVIIFAVITGVIAALQYFTEAAVASSVASGDSSTKNGIGNLLGYPANSLLTYTEWLYVRGFSNFQLGYAAALAVLLFVVAGLFVGLLLRQFNAFTPEGKA